VPSLFVANVKNSFTCSIAHNLQCLVAHFIGEMGTMGGALQTISTSINSLHHLKTIFLSLNQRCLMCKSMCLAKEDEARSSRDSGASVDLTLDCWSGSKVDGPVRESWE